MYSKKIKDYDSIEESQKIKGSNELESDVKIETRPKKDIKSLVIVIVPIILFFGLIIYLFILQLNKQKNRAYTPEIQQVQQNVMNSQNGQNQPIQQNGGQAYSSNQNLQASIDASNPTYIFSHRKRNHSNVPISELLPKIRRKSVNNITEILKSRTLNIKDKKITNEYIKFVKPLNETLETKYKQILFPDKDFFNCSYTQLFNVFILS